MLEHFRPQSDPTIDSLDFANLLCSCQKNLQKGEPRHCGHLKGNWFDDKLLISPLDSTCSSRFAFTADGHIKPRKEIDPAAKTTIEKLGLNIPKLRDLRKHAIEPFLDENLSTQEFQQFVQGYLLPLASGEFSPFWTTIKCLNCLRTVPTGSGNYTI